MKALCTFARYFGAAIITLGVWDLLDQVYSPMVYAITALSIAQGAGLIVGAHLLQLRKPIERFRYPPGAWDFTKGKPVPPTQGWLRTR